MTLPRNSRAPRPSAISHQRAQDLIDEVTRLGFNAAQVAQMSPDDPVEMLEFVSQIAKREMLADVRSNVDYPAGTPKPQAPVKARGRHGSRVQRSTARRRDWRRMVAEYGSEVRR